MSTSATRSTRPTTRSTTRACLSDVAAVGTTFGVSVNDVVLGAVAGAFRGLLLDRGERPDAHRVRSLGAARAEWRFVALQGQQPFAKHHRQHQGHGAARQ
jgi:hypothetical protein